MRIQWLLLILSITCVSHDSYAEHPKKQVVRQFHFGPGPQEFSAGQPLPPLTIISRTQAGIADTFHFGPGPG